MLKFFRKYNKWILAVGASLLMVAFLIQPVLGMFFPKPEDQKVGEVFGREVKELERRHAETDLAILTVLEPLGGWAQAMTGGDEIVWLLILADAERMGLHASGWAIAQTRLQLGLNEPETMQRAILAAQRQSARALTPADIDAAIGDWLVAEQYATLVRGDAPLERSGTTVTTTAVPGLRRLLKWRQEVQRIENDPRLAQFASVPELYQLYLVNQVRQAAAQLWMQDQQPRVSLPTLTRFAQREVANVSGDIVVIPAAAFLDEVGEPAEPQLRTLFNEHRDRAPGARDGAFGYRLPARAKVEAVAVPLAALRSAAPSTITGSALTAAWEAYGRENLPLRVRLDARAALAEADAPATRPAGTQPATQPAERPLAPAPDWSTMPWSTAVGMPAVRDYIQDRARTDVALGYARAIYQRLNAKLGDGGRSLAEAANAALTAGDSDADAGLPPAPPVAASALTRVDLPDGWLAVEDLTEAAAAFAGNDASPPATQPSPMLGRVAAARLITRPTAEADPDTAAAPSVSETRTVERELSGVVDTEAEEGEFRRTVPLVWAIDAPADEGQTDDDRRVVYYLRVTDAQAAHPPAELDEVRDRVERDARLKAAYELLVSRADTLESEAASTSLDDLADRLDGPGHPVSVARFERQARSSPLPGVGRSEAVINAVFDRAAELGEAVEDAPAAERVVAAPAEQDLALAVVELDAYYPVTRTTFDQIAGGNWLAQALAQRIMVAEVGPEPLSLEVLAERTGWEPVERGDDDEADAPAAPPTDQNQLLR